MEKVSSGPVRLYGEYWRSGSQDVQLYGSSCTKCGAGYLPSVATCSKCRGREFKEVLLSPTGTLYTYTTIHKNGGVWPDVYTLGYVDFPEGVRVCGHIAHAADIHIGMPMKPEKAVLYKDQQGRDVECFRFAPAEVTK